MSGAIQELAELLARLPGIGRRTAQRLTFHLLTSPRDYAKSLGEAVANIQDLVHPCSSCGNLAEVDPCPICTDPRRDRSQICIVAGIPDLIAIEESGSYRGLYHVLGGLLSPLDGVGPDDLHMDLLQDRVVEGQITEIIIATRPSVEGEATSVLVSNCLKDKDVRITRIASGVPHGGELEYADRITLGRAFQDRRDLS